ncbi:MAG: hypothetical protein KAJ01_05820 [Candidatus Hydrogenedentes bacterium]|nr:hypothetical protein [Candidatus Hydrogenedentota bacterium]
MKRNRGSLASASTFLLVLAIRLALSHAPGLTGKTSHGKPSRRVQV